MSLLDELNSALPPPVEEESLLDKLNRVVPQESTVASRAIGVADAGLSLASAGANTLVGGLAGLVATPLFGAETGANVVNSFTNTIREPQTTEGRENLQSVGGNMQSIIDELNIPLANIGFFIEILTNQGIEQAIDTFSRIPKEGAGVVAGDRVLEETGSPLLATGARILPEAIVEIVGAKGGSAALRGGAVNVATDAATGLTQPLRGGSGAVGEAVKDSLTSGIKNTVIDVFEYQSPAKKKVAELINEGSTDKSTAGFRLSESMRKGKKIVVSDKAANAAMKQGWDEGTIALLKGSSATDRAKALKMLERRWGNINDKGKRARASNIVGDTALERYEIVYNARKAAGERIDLEAKKLGDKPSGAEGPFEQFKTDLEEAGVTFDADGKPNYEFSAFEDFDADQKLLNTILKRIYRDPSPTANNAHKLKRFIDAKVTYGKKSPGGLEQTAENTMKDLRHRIDEQLDTRYEAYNEANTTYKDTRDALEAFQSAAGKKMDLGSPSANAATGVLMRKLLGNGPSRQILMDATDGLEAAARRNGGKFEDDYYAQTVFIDELERILGAEGGTSLMGQVTKSLNLRDVPMTQENAVIKGAEKVIEMINPKNQEEAVNAMRALLKEMN
jgi:hypothetical protein